MLRLTDYGCTEHPPRQISLSGSEAEMLKDILFNLPCAGDFHTFICGRGHTHCVSYHILTENWYPSAASFTGKGNLLKDTSQ